MAVATLTSTSASPQTWTVPAGLTAGTRITVESWGAGSGGSGGNASNRAGGAGAAYAKTPYVLTPNDITNGVSYIVSAGGAGTGSASSSAGPDASFSTNNLNIVPNSTNYGAVVGTVGSGGVLSAAVGPEVAGGSAWGINAGINAVWQVIAFGTDPGGLPYIDLRLSGTSAGAGQTDVVCGWGVAAASSTYTASFSHQLIAGSTANLSEIKAGFWCTDFSTPIAYAGFTPTSTLTTFSTTGTSIVGNTASAVILTFAVTGAVAFDITIRFAGIQLEQAGSATFFKSAPGYCLAQGGGGTSGTTGGTGGQASACIPINAQYTGAVAVNGGNGATLAQGGGGGGSAGPQGAGASSTSATGGTGDNGSGGAHHADNVLGGGGGNAGNPGETGGNPGAGGGANTSTVTGYAGGGAQIRITYLVSFIASETSSGAGTLVPAPVARRITSKVIFGGGGVSAAPSARLMATTLVN